MAFRVSGEMGSAAQPTKPKKTTLPPFPSPPILTRPAPRNRRESGACPDPQQYLFVHVWQRGGPGGGGRGREGQRWARPP